MQEFPIVSNAVQPVSQVRKCTVAQSILSVSSSSSSSSKVKLWRCKGNDGIFDKDIHIDTPLTIEYPCTMSK